METKTLQVCESDQVWLEESAVVDVIISNEQKPTEKYKLKILGKSRIN